MIVPKWDYYNNFGYTDQAEAKFASIRSDVERYVRIKLAGEILRDQIARYRGENQAPLLGDIAGGGAPRSARMQMLLPRRALARL